jgi:hypothetical protein
MTTQQALRLLKVTDGKTLLHRCEAASGEASQHNNVVRKK